MTEQAVTMRNTLLPLDALERTNLQTATFALG